MLKQLLAVLVLALLTGFTPWQPAWAEGTPAEESTEESPPKDANGKEQPLAEQIASLIQQLGSPEYLTRRRAEKALERIGPEAFDALKEAEQNPDIEIATAARYLSARIQVQWAREGDSKEVLQVLQQYGDLSEEDRAQRIEQLGRLPEDVGVAALCRIIRLESSARLSKQAALVLLELPIENAERWKRRSDMIQATLGVSQRPAASWLRTELKFLTDSEASLADWERLAAAERKLLKENPADTSRQIFSVLLRHQSALLRNLGKRDAAQNLLAELIDLETGDPESLLQLVDWLSADQAWDLVDRVAKKFEAQFKSDPVLLYTLAELKRKQAKDQEALELAAKALELSGENSLEHLRTADKLQKRGFAEWAEKEYRETIRIEGVTGKLRVYSSYRLAELLHDQLREKEAAVALSDLLKGLDMNLPAEKIVDDAGLNANAMRSRAEYFFACDHEQKKNYELQRKHLEQAIEHDPSDADVLIAMHRYAKADDAFRARTLKLIEKAAAKFRQEIEDEPENPQGYNQFAWLIGNTEGDYDEAVRFSEHSLALDPDRPGYLDTLGRCYYAKGDLTTAIKHQARAVQLEPSSQVIRRQLEFFQREQAKAKAAEPKSGDAAPAKNSPPEEK